jgi:FMN-dependent NADH-azoreductase
MKLLRIDSSPFGEAAVSRRLTEEFVRKWLRANPGGGVMTRDLTANSIPVIDAAWVSANYTPKESRTHQQAEHLKLSTGFITELLDADEYVMGMPMHNWGPPASFKLWVDQIVTPLTKSTRPLDQKRVTFIIAAGAVYTQGSADASKNYLVPWLRTLFGFLGIRDMRFVIADGTREMNNGKIDRATFLEPHIKAIHALFANQETSIRRLTMRLTTSLLACVLAPGNFKLFSNKSPGQEAGFGNGDRRWRTNRPGDHQHRSRCGLVRRQ